VEWPGRGEELAAALGAARAVTATVKVRGVPELQRGLARLSNSMQAKLAKNAAIAGGSLDRPQGAYNAGTLCGLDFGGD
jgi:hypothetical protein